MQKIPSIRTNDRERKSAVKGGLQDEKKNGVVHGPGAGGGAGRLRVQGGECRLRFCKDAGRGAGRGGDGHGIQRDNRQWLRKNAGQEAKRIYTASMDLETTGFDQAVEGLAALTEKCEGWYESSSIQNGSGYRYADYTVRVPVEHYQSFLTQAGELCPSDIPPGVCGGYQRGLLRYIRAP